MKQNDLLQEPANEQTSRRLPWGTIVVVGLILIGLVIWRSPPNSFHPTCTYTVNARVTADIVVGGEKLSSSVVYQNSRSRRWISIMNSAGCTQSYGNALTYRLADDRVLIGPARLCRDGEKALAASSSIDVLDVCTGKQAEQNLAFIVDSATRPTKWRTVAHGFSFRITRMTATSTWSHPTDDIASVAPNLLKSDFKTGGQTWWRSPERLIPYWRRYNERRHKPDKAYEFEVTYEAF